MGYSPQGPKESNMTEHVLSFSCMYLYVYNHTCILNNFCNLLFNVSLYNFIMHCLIPIIIVTLALTVFLFLGVKILDYINSMKTRKLNCTINSTC